MIRKATPQNIPSIQNIVRMTWPETYGEILSVEQIIYMLDLFYSTEALKRQMENGHNFAVLTENDIALGFIDIEKIADTRSKLHKIYLLPDAQGKGYGNILIQFAIEKAIENGSSILQLNVNRYNMAINFYKRNGFSIVDEVDIPIGNNYFMNDYVMEKLLYVTNL